VSYSCSRCWLHKDFHPTNQGHSLTHYSAIQPAPDPVKLDPNFSPLGGETTPTPTSTPVSTFSSDLGSDAVEQGPGVKIFSAAVDENEFQKVLQGQIILAATNTEDILMKWLVDVETNIYLHEHSIICTYKDTVKQTQGRNKTYLILYVVVFSPDHAS
jgi:hypothetical protein